MITTDQLFTETLFEVELVNIDTDRYRSIPSRSNGYSDAKVPVSV